MTIEKLTELWKELASTPNEAGMVTWQQKAAEHTFFQAIWKFEKEHPDVDVWTALEAAH